MTNSLAQPLNPSLAPLVVAKGVGWRVQRQQVLEGISLALHPGEFVGLIGPNGAGKSSLLRLLYRRMSPSIGSIELAGVALESYSSLEIARHIAVVQQEASAEFSVTVKEVIELGLIPHQPLFGRQNRADHQRVLQAAEAVDVAGLLERPLDELSGGEKQRVMIARAIVQRPQVLLMDEPTNHLDVEHQMDVLSLAKQLGIAVLVSIHDLNLAAAYCDRLLVLCQGQLVAEGSPENVLTEPLLQEVFGVKAEIDRHPDLQTPRITYRYTTAQEGTQ